MSQDALIRVRLDTTGAKGDLDVLYDQMRRAPGIGVGGGAGGGGGGGAGGGGGGGGGLGALLAVALKSWPVAGALAAGAMIAAPAARDLFSPIKGMLGGLGEELNPFAGWSGAERGLQKARSQVAETLGAARGYGLIGEAESQSLYDMLSAHYGRVEEGKARIASELGWEVTKDTAADGFDRVVGILEKIAGLLGIRP